MSQPAAASQIVLLVAGLLVIFLGSVWAMLRSRVRDPKWEFFSNLFQVYGLDDKENGAPEGGS